MFHDVSRFEAFIPDELPNLLVDLDPRLRIYGDNSLEVWYSPIGVKPMNPKVWILGITPGWQQMQIAYEGAIEAVRSGLNMRDAAALAKPKVAFAGSMRNNFIAMLDGLELPSHVEATSSAELFGSDKLRTGSVLKYPVFMKGKNYTGHTPNPLKHSALIAMIDEILAVELEMVSRCLIIPLGNAVESVLRYSIDKGRLDPDRVLFGFPHPSGANGHRVRQYRENKETLVRAINSWYRNKP